MIKYNDYKLHLGRALGASAVTLAAVSIVQRIRKQSDAFGYFIAAAVSGAAALLLTIDKFGWDSQVADLRKFVMDSSSASLDHLRYGFKKQEPTYDDGTASYDGYDDIGSEEDEEETDE